MVKQRRSSLTPGGVGAEPSDKWCGRNKPVSYKWEAADKGGADSWAGSTKLSCAWRALSSWCVTLAKPKPACPRAASARISAANGALAAVTNLLNVDAGSERDALDFQAFALQITPAVRATAECMAHAAKSAARVT